VALTARWAADEPRRVMAGLVPAIHVFFNAMMKGGWFYLMISSARSRNGAEALRSAPDFTSFQSGLAC